MAKNADIIRNHQKIIIAELRNFVTIMGTEAKNHFVRSFRNQGFTDQSLQRWQARKRVDRGVRGNRAILVKSGDLRRSIRIVSKTLTSVTIGSDLPYAKVHNDGLRAGRGRGFKMPKRQFIGYSSALSISLQRKLDNRIQKVFK